MSLTERLKGVGRIMGLAVALYSCGGDRPQGCKVDSDCHTPQVCVQSECKDPAEDDKLNCITMLDKVYDACCSPGKQFVGSLYCFGNFAPGHIKVSPDYPWTREIVRDCCAAIGIPRSKLYTFDHQVFQSSLDQCLQIENHSVVRGHLNCALAACADNNSPETKIGDALFACYNKYIPHGL